MSRALEARLSGEFFRAPFLKGNLHSAFRRTVNLAFGRRLITLALPEVPGLPDSIVLPPEEFCRAADCSVGAAAEKRGTYIFIGGECRFSLEGAVLQDDGITAGKPPDPETLENAAAAFLSGSGFARMPEERRKSVFRRLEAFCREPSEQAMADCAGMGCGLTPSSDDAMVGILAARAAGLLPAVRLDPRRVWELLEDRTTDVSRKYLCCAAEGRFSQPLREVFAEALPIPLQARVRAVAAVGATSGRDTLAGILFACRAAGEKGRNYAIL